VIGGAHTDDLPPPGPLVDGQLWWKSDSGTFYVYYDDGNSKQWVEAAAPAVPSAAYVQKTARRSNLVINGALNVSQENGNTEGTTNQYYAADQLLAGFSAASAAFGLARIAAANPSGSQYRLQFRVTTAKASLAAGDVAGITTRLEGLNVQDLGWSNATSQKDAVLAFGFRGPAGTYSVALRNNSAGVTHTFVASFTVTAGQANTDTQQVIKVPAPVAMTTWAVDNTCAIELWITLACGTTYLAAAGWNSGNFLGVTGMSNGLAAVQSFQIWDIGLYADPDKTGLAPSFEVPDYATELAKCQRYFWANDRPRVSYGYNTVSGRESIFVDFPGFMRTIPTVTSVFGGLNACTGGLENIGASGFTAVLNATAGGFFSGQYNTNNQANARM
jgi:hypothetical protein